MLKRFRLISLLLGLAASGRAGSWDKLTHVHVNEPFRIGSHVLQRGDYDFRLADVSSNRTVLQVRNAATGHLVLELFGTPSYRTELSEKTVLAFSEPPGDELRSLRQWFFPGDEWGLEFPEASTRGGKAFASAPAKRLPSIPNAAPRPATTVADAVPAPPPPSTYVRPPVQRAFTNRRDPAPVVTYADKWAILIGVSRTVDPSTELRFATKDAFDIDLMLKDPNTGRFPADHVRLLVNEQATHDRIIMEIRRIGQMAKPGDLVFVYWSGHGVSNIATRQRYLATFDAVRSNLGTVGFEMSEFGRVLGTYINAQVVAVLDACESGGLQDSPKGLVLAPNVVVIASSQADEDSWIAARLENSYFTRLFADTMYSTGGRLSLSEIFERLTVYLPLAVKAGNGNAQHPVMLSANRGDDIVIGAPIK